MGWLGMENGQELFGFIWQAPRIGAGKHCECFTNLMSITGWWFGTFFIFPYFGNNTPIWLIFFRGVGQPPTRSSRGTPFCAWSEICHLAMIDIPSLTMRTTLCRWSHIFHDCQYLQTAWCLLCHIFFRVPSPLVAAKDNPTFTKHCTQRRRNGICGWHQDPNTSPGIALRMFENVQGSN